MAFGKKEPSGGGGSAPAGMSFQRRDLVIVDGEESTAKSGKVYWRVKDASGKYYSVWEAYIKADLEEAAESGTPIPCAVRVEPKGDKTYYSITATGASVDSVIAESGAKAQASAAPGGRNSEFGKRMHPDDALRVTNLALMGRSLHLLEITVDDRPEGTNRFDYIKGNFLAAMQFLGSLIELPRTPTPDASFSKAAAPAAADFSDDEDIPF